MVEPATVPTDRGAGLPADARLVAAKDLRLEWRSRVVIGQVLPFAILVLVLFGFALDPDRRVLVEATPGLYWLTVLLSTLLAVHRISAIEAENGVGDALRLSTLDASGIFLGKAAAIAIQLLALQIVLLTGVTILYGTTPHLLPLLAATCLTATVGLSAVGALLGTISSGLRARDSLLAILLLPTVAPVLIAATQAFTAAYQRDAGAGIRWLALLAVFGCLYLVVGIVAFDTLLEDT